MTTLDVQSLKEANSSLLIPSFTSPSSLCQHKRSYCTVVIWLTWAKTITQQKMLPNLSWGCLFWQPCWLLLAWFEHKVWGKQMISSRHLANRRQSQKKNIDFLDDWGIQCPRKSHEIPYSPGSAVHPNTFGLYRFSPLTEANMSVFWGVLHY